MTEQELEYVKKCIQEDIHRFYIWGKWKKKRDEVLRMDKHECQDCKAAGRYAKANTVHHNQFLKRHPECALELWYTFGGKQYRNLVSLCHACHERRHGHRQQVVKEPLTTERWD